ncbi:MAG: hypothetical protein LBC85_00770 [Fibromonadaceae bacterium]|nr:hypothetical protein [Fibromonadaceae bacterium]
MNCPNLETNKERCPCPSTDCGNHGFCCECVANHRQRGDLPLCLRSTSPRP